MKIYIIDNSMMTWAWIAEIASHMEGVEVVGFSYKADEAINKLNELNPDMVIFHQNFSNEGNSIETIKKMKHIKPDIFIAMLSSDTSLELRDACRNLGIAYIFIQMRDYYEKINEILVNTTLSSGFGRELCNVSLNN